MKNLICGLLLVACFPATAQIGNYLGDETGFYAETKQVNQFFRRFNNEEGKDGVKYDPSDKRYHNLDERKKYLDILFDASNASITSEQKKAFVADVNNRDHPTFLDFHKGEWYGEVVCKVLWNGKEENLTLFMKLEQEREGYKWVMHNAYFEPFARMFKTSQDLSSNNRLFMHPMSHELDFMNLNKVFQDKQNLEDYTEKEHTPDQLTLLMYEAKKGTLEFKTVVESRFHFFQIKGWYFEIAEFNRSGLNRGWLISSLTQVPDSQKPMFKKFILREQ